MITSDSQWPDQPWLVAMIESSFDFLRSDFGFVRGPHSGKDVSYDLRFMGGLTRIRIAGDFETNTLTVSCCWPEEKSAPTDPEPVISLLDVVAMQAPNVELRRDIATESVAQETLNRSAELLKELAADVLSGGSGLLFDFLAWKRRQGDRGAGQWWGLPVMQELAEATRPRSRKEIEFDFEFEPLHFGAHRDPERVWSDIVGFVRRHPESMDAWTLLEDVMFEHGEAFIDRIEALARTDEAIRSTIATGGPIGGIGSEAVDRYNRLQEELEKDATRAGWTRVFRRRSRRPR